MTVRPRILCLDDEQYVLDGLQRTLRASYTVSATTDPQTALSLLAQPGGEQITVIISDMRMPEMSGIAVLEKAAQIAPDVTRILLTGDAEISSAVDAINRGNLFRFVLKPCPPDLLRSTLAAATEQHWLMRAERVLLQDTLKGCIDALVDTLAMAQPAIFSRAGRLRRLMKDICTQLTVTDAWQIEMAAQLGEIGAITLPPTVVDALQSGLPASPAEAEMLASLPALADNVLAHIPRMEPVREIIRHQLPTDRNPVTPLKATAPEGARLLQAVREYDALTYRGMPVDLALTTLTFRKTHDPLTIGALIDLARSRVRNDKIREIPVSELAVGMELATDLRSDKGLLLVSRGQVMESRMLTRIVNFASTIGLGGPVLIREA
jgi:response regulator RpfG family c-di-GMP phosphodiesterase